MKVCRGLVGAKGRAAGRIVLLEKQDCVVEKRQVADGQAEVDRFNAIRAEYCQELQTLYEETQVSLGKDAADIFKAYQQIAKDDFFFKKPLKRAVEEGINPDFTIEEEKKATCKIFEAMPDPYMRERASDICNVCDELIRRLNGIYPAQKQVAAIKEDFIVVAEDLTPVDTVQIDKTHLAGMITEKGGVTSHVVILAKTLGIPAVVGASGILEAARGEEYIFLNGDEGVAEIDPDESFLKAFEAEREAIAARRRHYAEMAEREAVTKDGHKVHVCVNSGDADSIETFDARRCDGVGLFRTEFLYMNHPDYPPEDVQYEVYKAMAEKAGGKEIIIRTLDIGGDKQLGYMNLPQEGNPFLGYRAIRICLDRREVFHTQLRAILRASAHGNIKIMFPMIVTLEELRQAKACVEEAKASLDRDGLAYNKEVPVGIMIETPASVLISDKLAREADFFSIGTNDLIQYITATDRQNEKVQYLYNVCNLSVLTAIATVIRNAHAAGIPVGMCGEAASEELLTPLLLDMGLDEFSMVPAQVGKVKALIAQYDMGQLKGLTEEVLACSTTDEVRQILKDRAVEA